MKCSKRVLAFLVASALGVHVQGFTPSRLQEDGKLLSPLRRTAPVSVTRLTETETETAPVDPGLTDKQKAARKKLADIQAQRDKERKRLISLNVDWSSTAQKTSDILTYYRKKISRLNKQSLIIDQTRVLGENGGWWFAAQTAIFVFLLYGYIPVLDDIIDALAGSFLIWSGVFICVMGLLDMGYQYTPSTVPVEDGDLKKDGIFSVIRHPIDAGFMVFSLGIAVETRSIERVLLTIVMYIFLDRKNTIEEERLVEKYQDKYLKYIEEVPWRYAPTIV
uniref:Protein-S-isoprenylcysteine O-methyltransferase n=1 Tax=Chromera velia CCMP2878 TaxID=1169474 RepID=A0A0G4GFZ3_9ALVE|mmetsp:Transcript_34414/g.68037  ORF Transcript_34414/g.68037 Transcript_34414/m.68037 type:complete len:278 (+) Transcript_34414:161-994(+)|eukprot:Cvel_4630.t1-p1 / transcript=Cvel_4630.t1 / gene=Cvel_4630 / organism=Chromera_velia_CCMP2878 / gene_product=hypothetical protein / transcript_product=hypothetical protein / location=Cvel_scaffold204:27417-30591(-) / protein_length=277 / sequence_SO=supercontig / SO=protein_coding / is_pseudo=false